MHALEYIRAIWEGDLEGAVRQIYRHPGYLCHPSIRLHSMRVAYAARW